MKMNAATGSYVAGGKRSRLTANAIKLVQTPAADWKQCVFPPTGNNVFITKEEGVGMHTIQGHSCVPVMRKGTHFSLCS